MAVVNVIDSDKGKIKHIKVQRGCGLNFALYVYPTVSPGVLSTPWQRVYDAQVLHPNVQIIVAANPNSGPGSSSDANYVYAIKQLRSVGVMVIGYIPTGYNGNSADFTINVRTTADIQTMLDNWFLWYGDQTLSAGLGLSGVMYDEMWNAVASNPSGESPDHNGPSVAWYALLATMVRAKLGGVHVTGNPGTDTVVEYANIGYDSIKVAESNGLPTLETTFDDWKLNYPKRMFAVIPHTVPSLSDSYIKNAARHVGNFYATDDGADGNPWNSVSIYFERIVEVLDSCDNPDCLVKDSLAKDETTLTYTIDGGGAVISTGIKGPIQCDYDARIVSWTLLADQSGSIVVDIWKDTYTNYPATNADSICGIDEPEIASNNKAQANTTGNWNREIVKGNHLLLNVDSCVSITRAHLALKVRKL